jgi:hypothetical protein
VYPEDALLVENTNTLVVLECLLADDAFCTQRFDHDSQWLKFASWALFTADPV